MSNRIDGFGEGHGHTRLVGRAELYRVWYGCGSMTATAGVISEMFGVDDPMSAVGRRARTDETPVARLPPRVYPYRYKHEFDSDEGVNALREWYAAGAEYCANSVILRFTNGVAAQRVSDALSDIGIKSAYVLRNRPMTVVWPDNTFDTTLTYSVVINDFFDLLTFERVVGAVAPDILRAIIKRRTPYCNAVEALGVGDVYHD